MKCFRENIIRIEDFNMTELDVYARLKDAQLLHYFEPELGLFIAESSNVILRALKAGYEPMSLLIETRRIEELDADEVDKAGVEYAEKIAAAKVEAEESKIWKTIPNSGSVKEVLTFCPDVPIYTSDVGQLNNLIGYKLTGGVLCAMRRRKLPSLQEVCEGARRIVVLEKVMNPINVGSIFRSSAALGVDAVILTAGCADPLYRRSSRVSVGTIFQVPWTYLEIEDDNRERVRPSAEHPGRYVNRLQEMGFKTAALALTDDSVSVDDEGLLGEEKLAIIMGTEGDGLFPETIADCDYTVKIPMTNGVDSLNVAAASAIAIWQMTR